MNPFPRPGPLCPWESSEHLAHYATVDHTEDAFTAFKAAVPDAAGLTGRGRVVLASGGSGCGKTSLMHRCAHWLQEQGGADPRVIIVDLTPDDRKGADTEQRVRHICARLSDELESEGLFGAEQLAVLRDRRDDPYQALPVLSKYLGNEKVVAVVLLPPSDLAEEVLRFADLVRKNVLFFAETAYDHVAHKCARMLGPGSPTPIEQLQVGQLKVEDGWGYVHHHLTRRPDLRVPAVTEQTMRTVVEKRISGAGGMTVKELQTLLHGIFQEALAAAAPTLEFRDFADYYIRSARLI
ncbi:ATP-binding protein [Actinomadura fulvescens]|uniref:AAA+ ATPase domain-containing protein n=1 Tax=Actinomadura fulvescens TaxID=46160 RepID=A0ABP6CBH0_9ACTN